MNRVYMIFMAMLVTLQLQSQHFSYTRVDFKKVRSAVSKEKSSFFYPVLFERYRNGDTTLNREELRHLYYGFTFREDYQPYTVNEADTAVNNLLIKDTLILEDFSDLYSCCREILELHPFSTHHLLTAAIACNRMGHMEEARMYFYKYNSIISTILASGDGATEQSAWSVILVSDEYELIRALGFNPSGKQKMMAKSRCDYVYLAANEYNVEGFYFDISRPFSRGFK
jgi:hypothetical protein